MRATAALLAVLLLVLLSGTAAHMCSSQAEPAVHTCVRMGRPAAAEQAGSFTVLNDSQHWMWWRRKRSMLVTCGREGKKGKMCGLCCLLVEEATTAP